jgi:hypothetical protein
MLPRHNIKAPCHSSKEQDSCSNTKPGFRLGVFLLDPYRREMRLDRQKLR